MADFFITFGQKDKDRKDGWIRVSAKDYDEAFDFAERKFGKDWSMLRPAEKFDPQYFPKGELANYEI